MRIRFLFIAVLWLLATPALASEGGAPGTNGNAPPAHDRLVDTPMECLMPPLPSLMMDNTGGAPLDLFKRGAAEMNDFIQDSAIYLNCLGNKAKSAAIDMYNRFMESRRAKADAARGGRQDPGS